VPVKITYTDQLIIDARMVVSFERQRKTVGKFSVQLEVKLRNGWHKVIRYDNAHGRAHRHIFYPDGSEFKQDMLVTNYGMALTASVSTVKTKHPKFIQDYCLKLNPKQL